MADSKDTEADQVHGKIDSSASGEEQSEVHICEPCRVDNNTLPAEGWCETCDEMLCNDCYKIHCRPTLMRNHQIMCIADMKKMKQGKRLSTKCDKHEGKPLEYFCADHADLGCSQCFVTKHRPCSKVFCISDIKTKDMKEFKTLKTLLSQFDSRLKANEETLERNFGRVARQHDKVIADIKEIGDKLKAQIDCLVEQQILKANKRNQENMRNMKVAEELHTAIVGKFKTGKEMLAAGKNDNNRLFVAMKFVQGEAESLKIKLDEYDKKNKFRKYEFQLSPGLADILENVKHLGTLKDTQLLDVSKSTDDVFDVVEVRRSQQFERYKTLRSNTNDAIMVSTDHDIRLLQVLLYGHDHGDTKVVLSIRGGGKCLTRCSNTYQREADQDVMAVNVVKESGVRGITLQVGLQYDIGVTREGERGWYYYGADVSPEVTEKGVTITFTNTDGTNVHRGIIAGLRFNII